MSINIIESKLNSYNVKTKQDELNALKEIYQEIALAGLSRSEFFNVAAFQGGTCLRILYNLERFSEDLDFVLIGSHKSFNWTDYIAPIELEFNSFGLDLDIISRSKADSTNQRAFIKQNSFGKVLSLKNKLSSSDKQSIKIKLEIDTHPPLGSEYQTHYLDFPYPFPVLAQDPNSLFASKCHALLCRPFIKGRDWFDFLWYVQHKTKVNIPLLEAALNQFGPYKDKTKKVDKEWLILTLKSKIKTINWRQAKLDANSFLNPENRKLTEIWSSELFLSFTDKLSSYL